MGYLVTCGINHRSRSLTFPLSISWWKFSQLLAIHFLKFLLWEFGVGSIDVPPINMQAILATCAFFSTFFSFLFFFFFNSEGRENFFKLVKLWLLPTHDSWGMFVSMQDFANSANVPRSRLMRGNFQNSKKNGRRNNYGHLNEQRNVWTLERC